MEADKAAKHIKENRSCRMSDKRVLASIWCLHADKANNRHVRRSY